MTLSGSSQFPVCRGLQMLAGMTTKVATSVSHMYKVNNLSQYLETRAARSKKRKTAETDKF